MRWLRKHFHIELSNDWSASRRDCGALMLARFELVWNDFGAPAYWLRVGALGLSVEVIFYPRGDA